MGKAIFVTGTGTDVGKTFVTGLIVKKLRDSGRNAGYYKAALSGAEPDAEGALQPGDALYVKKTAGITEPVSQLVSYVYREAVSPHLAARWNKRPVDLDVVKQDFARAAAHYDFLTMEGSGGILCPLRWDNEQHLMLEDMIKALGLSCFVVADAGLGTINSTVLTVDYMQRHGLNVKAVFLNHWLPGDKMQEDNRQMIKTLTGLPIAACIRDDERDLDMDADALAAYYV
ncbi:MAG: dethiobiotin synthase [Acidaminococcus sp.]|jgi:dethiobiotin synthetase|nr:dethiobiotin synthase [Acidaminococcus sp.]MCI2114206.1 dethiobiotin synthase [Acidaminococcus sp.]MCI2116141.1 dethiobiotin synthase [Acidaminococcus sp.]